MLIGYGAVAQPGRAGPPVGPTVIEGEYLARDLGHMGRERPGPGGAPHRTGPIRTPNTIPVDLYLRTGRPWAAPRQGRHVDLYV